MASGDSVRYEMRLIGIEQGLPNRRVHDLVQDRFGFMWISCTGTIYRYDGLRFKTYSSSDLGIVESKPPKIAIDRADRLWYLGEDLNGGHVCGTIDGRLDSILPLAKHIGGPFLSPEVVYISNPEGDNEAVYAVIADGSVWRMGAEARQVFQVPQAKVHTLSSILVHDGEIWIATDSAIFKTKRGKLLQTFNNTKEVGRLLVLDSAVYAENYESGIGATKYICLEPEGRAGNLPVVLGRGKLKGMRQLWRDLLCVSSDSTLQLLDAAGHVLHEGRQLWAQGRLPNIIFYGGGDDRNGGYWIATDEGLLKISKQTNPFIIHNAGNSTRAIYQTGNRLWMGGYAGNFVQALNTGHVAEFLPYGEVGMSAFEDQQGHLWFGTGGCKLYEWIPNRDVYLKHELACDFGLFFTTQNPITGHFWIGSSRGLLKFDTRADTVTMVPLPAAATNLEVRQILYTSDGMWVVSNQGIYLLDAKSETVIQRFGKADGLGTDNFNFLHHDTQCNYWMGSRDAGLVRWDHATHKITQFTAADGLVDNCIYAVYEDAFQTLWLPTNRGLIAFDKLAYTNRTYLPQNGVAQTEFNTFAHFQAADGRLHFGGINGVTSFDPAAVQKNLADTTPLYATRVQTLVEGVNEFADLTADFIDNNEISLDPKDVILEVELAMIDYDHAASRQFAYRLSGLLDRWTYTTDPKLVFNHLPYGSYELQVRGRGASGEWSPQLLRIPIKVHSPYYLRWSFIAAMILLGFLLVALVFRVRVRLLRRDHRRLEIEVGKRTAQINHDKEIIAAQSVDLQEMDLAKSRFFANITHELRTPLTLILGPVGQVLSNPMLPSSLQPKLQGVHKNAEHLLTLINQLLDLSKLESNVMQVQHAVGDIAAHTAELVGRMQPLADQAGLQLDQVAVMPSWTLGYDSDKWEKILLNLIGNAIKFTPRGGIIKVILDHDATSTGSEIRLSVTDTGIGLAPAAQARIFDRFYQAATTGVQAVAGTGLGLALVRELVTLQGGKIHLHSTLGEGTSITLCLPIASHLTLATPDDGSSSQSTAASTSVAPRPLPTEITTTPIADADAVQSMADLVAHEPTSQLETPQILLIEDNAEMMAYIRSCLDEQLYTLHEAYDGDSGLASAQRLVPDLIISDLMMPGLDGLELTQAIRSHVSTSHIPVILLTARANLDSRMQGLRRGADAYITKPFHAEELVLRIAQLIAMRHRQQAYYLHLSASNDAMVAPPSVDIVEDRFILQLRAFIDEHLSDPDLNGDRIGDHFAMSRMQLHRKLKALTDTSISDFVRSHRLRVAQSLLAAGQLNVSEVAYDTGFSSPSHFSRVYKQEFGFAPSERA